jgi:hypothetical protein
MIRWQETRVRKHRHFCGTHLMAEWVDQDAVIVRLGALDTDPGARPAAHMHDAG